MNRPPKTKLIVALGGALLAASASLSHAAGLGKLSINSALGQPLSAEIELVSLQPGEFEAIAAGGTPPPPYPPARPHPRPRPRTRPRHCAGCGAGHDAERRDCRDTSASGNCRASANGNGETCRGDGSRSFRQS